MTNEMGWQDHRAASKSDGKGEGGEHPVWESAVQKHVSQDINAPEKESAFEKSLEEEETKMTAVEADVQ